MKNRIIIATVILAFPILAFSAPSPQAPPTTAVTTTALPSDWIDPETGHRVIRISTIPGSQSLYFHQNAYTAAGDKMFITTPQGLATIDLTTLGKSPCKNEIITQGNAGAPVLGPKTRTVYYARGNTILATHLDTHETRTVCTLPAGLSGASGIALNSDETLLASSGEDPAAKGIVATQPAPPRSALTPQSSANGRGENARSMCLYTINVSTGQIKRILYSTSWLNHTQFSPTDPAQILFCHEGDWHMVDRTWTIRADGSGLKMIYTRTMANEIEGHEFFSSDGKMVLYDLQTPRSGQFWLGGTDLASGQEYRWPLERVEWSVHYNQSHDGKLFSGDGGGPNSVANRTPLPENQPLNPPGNGMWMYLFTPQNVPYTEMKVGDPPRTIKVGKLVSERLVSLKNHNYSLEPNGRFSPDDKWLIFRSNMLGGVSHVYAVEVKKTTPQ